MGWRSPGLDLPDAVAAAGLDDGVAWHYGDPTAEQRALVGHTGLVDLSHRGVITVAGPDRLSWLNSMTTQHLTELLPGQSAETLVLSPKGHIEHALHLVDDGERVWITVEPGTAGALVDWLNSMRFMLRVEVAEVTDDWAVLADTRPGGPADGSPMVWVDQWPAVVGDSVAYTAAGTEHPEWSWREVLVPRAELAERLRSAVRADIRLVGTWASEALRVAAWRPRLGRETDHRTIPHELDWLRTAVHLHKGCYRGQETIARVHNLGRPPRRLVLLHLDGSEHVLPDGDAPVLHDDRAVGRVTTAARHHELGPIALAVVKRSVPVDAPLTVDGLAAAQETIVAP